MPVRGHWFVVLALAIHGCKPGNDDPGLTTGNETAGTGPSDGDACGNGLIDGEEECDSNDIKGVTCDQLGFPGGLPTCTSACKLDTSTCETCGNDRLDEDKGEQCDGMRLGGKFCSDLGYGEGMLECYPDCTYDLRKCGAPPMCGNGMVEPGEDCDTTDLAGMTACEQFQGYIEGGQLACSTECKFDFSGCIKCGDPGTVCEGFSGRSCCSGTCTTGTCS